jgi:hypothetical protein
LIGSIRLAVASFALVFCTVPAAEAISVTFTTPAGSSVPDGSVRASVEFDINPSTDIVTILLKNLLPNPKSVGTNLSDLFFTVSSGQTSATLLIGAGRERTVAADGSYTDGSLAAAGWVLTNVASRFHLDVLAGPGHAGPEHTIIGPPDASDEYSEAKGSIAGSGSHNPFLGEQAFFMLSIPGLTAASTISEATFSFGTTAGVEVTGTPLVDVPEPMTLLLWGTTISGGALVRWRRSRRVAA